MNHYLAMAFSVVIASIGQVVMKSAVMKGDSWLHSVTHIRTLSSFGLYIVSTAFGVYSLQLVPLKIYVACAASSFIIVVVLSAICLRESISRRRLMGCLVIVAGVIVFTARGA